MLRLQYVLEDFQIATIDSLQHAWSPCSLSPCPLCKCLLELKTSCLSWTQLSNFITNWAQLSDFITSSQAGCRLFWHCNNCVVSRPLSFSCCQSASLAPDWKLNHFPGWSAAHARGPGSSGAVIWAGERLEAPQLCVVCLDLAQTSQAMPAREVTGSCRQICIPALHLDCSLKVSTDYLHGYPDTGYPVNDVP